MFVCIFLSFNWIVNQIKNIISMTIVGKYKKPKMKYLSQKDMFSYIRCDFTACFPLYLSISVFFDFI